MRRLAFAFLFRDNGDGSGGPDREANPAIEPGAGALIVLEIIRDAGNSAAESGSRKSIALL